MHPYTFRAPSPSHGLTALWDQTVEPDMQGYDVLFGELWKRYNTLRIPILPHHQFQSKATNLAKRTKSREDLERLLEEECNKECKKLFDSIQRAYPETISNHEIFSCRDARNAATGACYGTLEAFVHLLNGIVFGWEADEIRSVTMNTDILVKGVDNVDPSSCEGCGSTRLLSCRTCEQMLDYCGNCGPQLDSCKCCSAIRPGDIDTDPMPCVDAVSFKRDTKAISDGTATDGDKSEEAESQSIQPTPRKRKRVQFSEYQGPECATSTFTSHRSTQRTATDANPTSDNGYQNPANKRRKLERSFGLEPMSINRPSPPPPATHERASRKRSRDKDDDIHDNIHNDNHRQKRQKWEDLAAYTATSNASSSIQQVAIEKVVGIEDLRFRRSNRKTRNASQIPTLLQSARAINTRSARRKGQSTFWELDHLGKPRSL